MTQTLSLAEPPLLRGYTYAADDVYQARNQRQLLALEIETNAACNWQCRYCASAGTGDAREADLNFLKDVIQQAKDLGARSIILSGSGEPTLYSKFRGLVQYIASRDLVPVIRTNLSQIDQPLADFLFRRQTTILGKLDATLPELHDQIANKPGAFAEAQHGLGCLIHAGFALSRTRRQMRLGLTLVLQHANLNELVPFWHYCRRQNLHPEWTFLKALGSGEVPAPEVVRQALTQVCSLDRTVYGYAWQPRSGCLRPLASMYVTLEGDLRPCAFAALDQHPARKHSEHLHINLKQQSLRECYDSDLFSYIRNIDAFLEGACGRCEPMNHCLGCRGQAYQEGIRAGLDPFAAYRQACKYCLK